MSKILNKRTKEILKEIVKDLKIEHLVDDDDMPSILCELGKRGCIQDFVFLQAEIANFINELIMEEIGNIEASEDADREEQLREDRMNIC